MPGDNPVVVCSTHAEQFGKVYEETDHDGTQTLVKQYWDADCGCQVEITLTIATQQPN
jgi:hypothetical protein